MFRRKGGRSLAFHREKIIGWLSLLAGKMREHSQSVFLIEGLQPSWLGTRTKRVAFGTIVALSLGSIYVLTCVLTGGLIGGLVGELSSGLAVGLIGGLIGGLSISVGAVFGCWSESPLRNGIISGSIGGLMTAMICGLTVGPRASLTFAPTKDVATHVVTGGLIAVLTVGLNAGLMGGLIAGAVGGLGIGPLNQITLVESISWKWNQFWKRTIPGSIVGFICGLILALIFWFILAMDNLLIGLKSIFPWLISAASYGLLGGLIGGVVSGLAGGFTDRVMVDKTSPNQGIRLSLKNSLAALLVTWLVVGLTVWLIAEPFFRLASELLVKLIAALILGLSVGLSVGLNRGGSAVIKHYALRLILWSNGYTPLKFIKFLDQCAKLILLKKVGGGYIFIHRMLLEYFADIPAQHTTVKSDSSISKTQR